MINKVKEIVNQVNHDDTTLAKTTGDGGDMMDSDNYGKKNLVSLS
jgi:hypothetical protein